MQTTISLQEGPRGKGGPFAEGTSGADRTARRQTGGQYARSYASPPGDRELRSAERARRSLWDYRTTRPSTVQIEPFRLDSDRYPLKARILARYADVDPLWHINNVAIAQYYEEARVSTTMMVLEAGGSPHRTASGS